MDRAEPAPLPSPLLPLRLLPPAPEPPPDLLRRVAREHSITVADLTGWSRARHLGRARRQVARELRARGETLARIGDLLGGRDHTTVIYLLGQKPGRS